MTRKYLGFCLGNRAIVATVFVFGMAGSNYPALAQSEAGSPGEQVIVEAPHYTVQRTKTHQSGVADVETISLSGAVNYTDLNLSKSTDAAELEKRISITAIDVCQELNRRFPDAMFPPLQSTDCVKSTTEKAMAAAKKVIAAAH